MKTTITQKYVQLYYLYCIGRFIKMSNAQYAAVMGGTGGVNISTDGTISAAATNAALAHMPLPIATKVTTNTQPTTSTTTQPAAKSGKIAAMERAKACAKAAKYTSIDDERRMKFLALLCGRGAFKNQTASVSQEANILLSRDRSGSIGGMGGMSPHVNDGKNSNNNSHSIGKKQGSSSSIANTSNTTQTTTTNEQNYQPTIPSSLSRRILHKSGVGYLDNSVPLILSAMSDRFLATILVQAKACRDRRIEGYKATIKERKKRTKHRKLVLKERLGREKRYKEEISKKRSMMEGAVMDAKELLEKDNNKKGSSSGGEDKTLFGLSEEEREAVKEYKKQAADVDAEEEYYNKYYGNASEDGNLDLDNISSDEEDDEDDELVLFDTDLKLRDLVRPLGAWGFDLTGKLGFTDKQVDDSDGDEYELVDNTNEDGGGSDEDDDEDQDDNVSYSDSSDMGTTDDDEGTGPKSPKKKKPPSPKKKSKAKKGSSSGGTKKSSTTTKKKPVKRKRDESKDDASSKSSGDGKPKAKKAATAASKKTEVATTDAKKK